MTRVVVELEVDEDQVLPVEGINVEAFTRRVQEALNAAWPYAPMGSLRVAE